MRSASATAARRAVRRGAGAAQDAVLVMVLGQRIDSDLAVAAARGDHRQFAAEVGRRLDDRRRGRRARRRPPRPRSAAARPRSGPCRRSPRGGSSAAAGAPKSRQRATQVLGAVDGGEGDGGHAARVEEGLLLEAGPGRRPGPGRRARPRRPARPARSTAAAGTFSNSKVTTSAGLGQGLQGRGDRHRRATMVRAATRLAGASASGVEDDDVEAQARGGQGQHAAELAAAQDADGRAGRERERARLHARLADASRAPTAVELRARRSARRSARAGSERARIWAASRPALRAPGLADRQGRPPARRPASGRWTAGNRGRSGPWTAIGTPSTGRSVSEAVMPGRCAAPPAPAMITLKPAALAPLGEGVHPLRRAVGRDDLGLVGDAQGRPGSRPHPSWSASRSGCP